MIALRYEKITTYTGCQVHARKTNAYVVVLILRLRTTRTNSACMFSRYTVISTRQHPAQC